MPVVEGLVFSSHRERKLTGPDPILNDFTIHCTRIKLYHGRCKNIMQMSSFPVLPVA